MTRRKPVRIYEDPSIERTAKIEAVRVWTEIEDLQIAGKPFYHARDIAFANNLVQIRNRYGKEVARRVEYAIMTRAPHTTHRRVQEAFNERLRIFAVKKWGRLRKRDRFSIWLRGYLWSLPPHKPGDPVIMI